MPENQRKLNWLFRTRNGIAVTVLLVAAITVAGFIGSEAGRIRVLQLAEGIGLHSEAEHELVPVTDEGGNILYWTCTMHPSVRAAGPGTCPI